MARSALPPEARRLRKVLYEAPDCDALRGLPLRKGITESFFADLAIGCLYRHKERAKKFHDHHHRIHARLLNKKGVKQLERAAAVGPAFAHLSSIYLNNDAARLRHHDNVVAWAEAEEEYLHPGVSLYALFRYLVKTTRGDKPGLDDVIRPKVQGIEYYVENYFPRILNLAGVLPHRAQQWTHVNVTRYLRRECGGKKAVDRAAFYLFSTDDRLKRYRPPAPPDFPASGPPDPELVASLIGRAMFRLPAPPNNTPPKPSRGGQHTLKS